jgi:hypothetical protein
MRLKRLDLTGRRSGSAGSAQIMRVNDFVGLSALLRNFCGPASVGPFDTGSDSTVRRSTPITLLPLAQRNASENETSPSPCETNGFAARVSSL